MEAKLKANAKEESEDNEKKTSEPEAAMQKVATISTTVFPYLNPVSIPHLHQSKLLAMKIPGAVLKKLPSLESLLE